MQIQRAQIEGEIARYLKLPNGTPYEEMVPVKVKLVKKAGDIACRMLGISNSDPTTRAKAIDEVLGICVKTKLGLAELSKEEIWRQIQDKPELFGPDCLGETDPDIVIRARIVGNRFVLRQLSL